MPSLLTRYRLDRGALPLTARSASVFKSPGSSSRSAQRPGSRPAHGGRRTDPAKELFSPRVGVKRQLHDGQLIALQKTPDGHAAGRLRQSEMPPVPGAPQSRMTFRAVGASVPSTKGRRIARTTPSTKASCPSTVFFHLSGQPFEAAQMLLFDFGGSFGQQAVGLHILKHLPALGQRLLCGVSAQLGVLFFSISSSFFCCSSRAAFISGRPGFSGDVFCVSKRSFPPGPNTSVHQVLPIVGVCHLPASVLRFFPV